MKSIFTALAISFFAANVFADAIVTSIAPHGKVEFEAIGKPSMLKIKGSGDGAIADLTVTNHKLNGTIKFDLKTLNTGIELRDSHMKEKYLQVNEKDFSTAVMTFKDLAIPTSWSAAERKITGWTFQATLRLHGVEKPITGTYNVASNKSDTSAKFDIKLSDFAIDIPQYLGVKVADVVNVTVSFPELKVADASATAEGSAPAKTKKK